MFNKRGVIRVISVGTLSLMFGACATTQHTRSNEQIDTAPRCTSSEVIRWYFSGPVKMQQEVVSACRVGAHASCMLVPFVIPIGGAMFIADAPVVLPLLLLDPPSFACSNSGITPSETPDAVEQQRDTEPSREEEPSRTKQVTQSVS